MATGSSAAASMGRFSSPAARIGLVIVIVALAILAWAGFSYAADKSIEADVVRKDCNLVSGGSIVVRTRLFRTEHTAPVDAIGCNAVPVGGFVVYHVRSQHTIVYEHEGGACLWDSAGVCR